VTETAGALRGIRVLDFGHYIPGPMLAMLLADQGAEVIKVEPLGWSTDDILTEAGFTAANVATLRGDGVVC
jgi:crotonobetainyl-CoA:carnitine CoA-transferase CaiB-like acyl-CoA transferase